MRGFLAACLMLPFVLTTTFVMAPDLANRLRVKIRRLMEDHGIKQQELADRLQVSRPRISQILKSTADLQATLTVDRLEILADTFGMTAPMLLLAEDESQAILSSEESSLLELFRLLPKEQRSSLLGLMHYVFEPRRTAQAERHALAILRQNLNRQADELHARSKRR